MCCAAGEQLFPALIAVFLACRGAQRTTSEVWVASVGCWALAYGLRGIIWHQLTDINNDRAAGVRTFALRHPRAAAVIGTFIIFPLELGALAAMLWQIGSIWPLAFLALYVFDALIRVSRWQKSPVIVIPKPTFFIVLLEFYSDLFPLALLIAATIRDRRNIIVLAGHVVLFPQGILHAIRRLSASIASRVVSASEPHHGGVG
jgi:hypothetical protein